MKKYLLTLAMILISVNAVSEDLNQSAQDTQTVMYSVGPFESASSLQSTSLLENAGPLAASNIIQDAVPLTTSLNIDVAAPVYIIPEVAFQTVMTDDLTPSSFTTINTKTAVTSLEALTFTGGSNVTENTDTRSTSNELTLSYAPTVYSYTSQTSISPN